MHSTVGHPYGLQVLALWLSFLPIGAIGSLMAGAIARGDRGFRRKIRITVPVPPSC
ncbi:MAG TPA: hypothetical protein VFA29_13520 [Candidatus Baltobacteraceae bacterium]|nr:hypothetical protein [Candidatus Baltobacteraceae bacterium]